jgi:hypothetical protein
MAVTESRYDDTETRTEKGISLARGPALMVGTILLAAGLYFLYKQHNFPKLSNFPSGNAPVDGKVFGIFGANGWTGMLTAVAGGLLLFGAAQHLLAKTMSLIVGVALGAAAIIALASGDVLGLAAANGWTELAWGVAAAILLFNTTIPRRRRTVAVVDPAPGNAVGRHTHVAVPPGATERTPSTTGAGAGTAAAEDPVADRERRYADEPGAAGTADDERSYVDKTGTNRQSRYGDEGPGPADDPEAGTARTEAPQVEGDAAPGEPPA